MAKLYLRQQKYQEALDAASQADYYYRGLTYQALGQKDQARADFENFLSVGGANDPEKISDAQARLKELQ